MYQLKQICKTQVCKSKRILLPLEMQCSLPLEKKQLKILNSRAKEYGWLSIMHIDHTVLMFKLTTDFVSKC